MSIVNLPNQSTNELSAKISDQVGSSRGLELTTDPAFFLLSSMEPKMTITNWPSFSINQ